jgi:hypothetical protein
MPLRHRCGSIGAAAAQDLVASFGHAEQALGADDEPSEPFSDTADVIAEAAQEGRVA